MQFAVPNRYHRPSPFILSSVPRQLTRRRRFLYLIVGLLCAFFIFGKLWGGRGAPGFMRPRGVPEVVLVTVLDQQKYSTAYLDKVIENRKEYAEAHGMLFL